MRQVPTHNNLQVAGLHCVWSLQPDGWRKTVLQQDDSASGSLVPDVLGVGCPANDTNYAWAVGTGGRVWRTTNGGVSWGSPMLATTTTLTAVCAYRETPTSAVQAWAVGGTGPSTARRTVVGLGLRVIANDRLAEQRLMCTVHNGDLNVWAVGTLSDRDSVIVHSTDGGQTLESQTAYTDYAHLISVTCGIDSVFFSADNGKVWRKTRDKATGWQTGWTDITKSGGLGTTGLRLAAVSDSTVYAAGSGGDVWVTSQASPFWYFGVAAL